MLVVIDTQNAGWARAHNLIRSPTRSSSARLRRTWDRLGSSATYRWVALSGVWFLLFAETLRAWVGQVKEGTDESRRLATNTCDESQLRPISNDTANRPQSLIAVLYEPPRAQRFGRYEQRRP